jgi:hypothetical protein
MRNTWREWSMRGRSRARSSCWRKRLVGNRGQALGQNIGRSHMRGNRRWVTLFFLNDDQHFFQPV